MNRIWIGALSVLALLLLVSLSAWALFGAAPALAVMAGGLLVLLLNHTRNLSILLEWLRDPENRPTPEGYGAWGEVFSALHRQTQLVRKQRRELADSLERFRRAWQALPNGVVILDAEDHIQWVNATAEQHLGLDGRRDLGFPITNLLRQPDFVLYLQAGRLEEPHVMRSGRTKGQILSIGVVAFGDGQRLIMTRDVTRWENLETMRRDFVANVSHELKTPLTVVSGFVEMLDEHWPDLSDTERSRYLALTREQAGRMQRLIEDLLTLSTLEAGTSPPATDRVEIAPLMDVLIQEAQALSRGRHTIRCEPHASVALLASEREILSALGNLVSNAVRYTPDGGIITLKWRQDNGEGIFTVEDTGIGIEPRHIPRLTERFYRVDRGRSRETGGTGLGLAIVKHVLTRHQAALEVHSETGRGSCFSAHFPANRIIALQAAA